MADRIDWPKIKAEYMSTTISYRNLADKYSISFSTLSKKARKEDWTGQRRRARENIEKKTIQKTIDKTVAKIAKELDKEYRIADRLADVLMRALEDEKQFRRHIVQTRDGDLWDAEERIFKKVDMKAISDAVKSLQGLEAVKRRIAGLLTVPEKEKIKLEKRRLAMEEKRSSVDDVSEAHTGVVVLPPPLVKPEPPPEAVDDLGAEDNG